MLRAVLFDFNGVILDDEPIHMMMFQKVMSEEGIALSQEDYYAHYLGMDDPGCFKAVYQREEKTLSNKKLDELIERKSALYDHYIKEHFEFFPKSTQLVKEAKSKYFVGIVSGALRGEIDFGLKKGEIKKEFDVIVSQEDVSEGKPSPAGYLCAVEKLNQKFLKKEKPILPEECLVIEDSIDGIHAAKEAGMRVAAVGHTYPVENLTQEADWVFEKIGDLSLKEIELYF